GLLIDVRQPSVRNTLACEMVEPRDRTIINIEAEAPVHEATEREPDRGLDGATMSDGNHVPACMLAHDALDGAFGAVIEIHKTLAAGRRLVDVGEPATAGRPRGDEGGAVHALPFPEILLGQFGVLRHAGGLRITGGPDRFRRLMRAQQVARYPHR